MYGSFPTPSQTAIYIGEYHIDDAYSIEWSYKDSTSPLYTYFSKNYANVAIGKRLVVGTISINYRYPGYLAHAILEAQKVRYAHDVDAIRQKTRDGASYVENYLDQMRHGSANDRLKLMMEASLKGPNALRKMSALASIAQTDIPGDSAAPRTSKTEAPEVFDVQNIWERIIVPIDIWTHYGDTDSLHTADIIHGVVFNGKSKEAMAGASASGGISAGGVNLLEVYSFFAKEVKQVTINPRK